MSKLLTITGDDEPITFDGTVGGDVEAHFNDMLGEDGSMHNVHVKYVHQSCQLLHFSLQKTSNIPRKHGFCHYHADTFCVARNSTTESPVRTDFILDFDASETC